MDGCCRAMGRNARLMTEEAKPFTKIALFLAKYISKHEAALTARDTQEAAHLIKWPHVLQANSSEDACGLPPSQHGTTAQRE